MSLILGASALPQAASAALPVGYVDAVGCDTIAGWAQDPDEPEKSIDVHVYFGGPAGSGAPAIALNANVHREDLCTAIGSCLHGYYQPTPYSLLDGVARPMHVYAIDSMGGPNPELGSSPQNLACVPVLTGNLRRVFGASTYDNWSFDPNWDLVPGTPPSAAELAAGADWPSEPLLVKGSLETVYLLDDVAWVKRPIAPTVMAAWHLSATPVEAIADEELALWTEGTPLRPRPMLVISGALQLVDDVQPQGTPLPNDGGGGSAEGSGGFSNTGGMGGEASSSGSGAAEAGSGGENVEPAASSSGCSSSADAFHAQGRASWLLLALGLTVALRKRR